MKRSIFLQFVLTLSVVLSGFDTALAQINPDRSIACEGAKNDIAFSPDGKLLGVGCSDNTIKLVEFSSGKVIKVLEGHKNPVNKIAFTSSGKYIAGTGFLYIGLWGVESGKLIRSYGPHVPGGVTCLSFFPNGAYLASGGMDQIYLWDVDEEKVVKLYEDEGSFLSKNTIYTVNISPDRKYIASTCSKDENIKLWNILSKEVAKTFSGHESAIHSVCFSADGKYLVSGSEDKTVKLWDVSSGELIRTYRGHDRSIKDVVISPDSRYIASVSNLEKCIKFWDVLNGGIMKSIKWESGSINNIAFSPDGRYLASSSVEDNIYVWDLSFLNNNVN